MPRCPQPGRCVYRSARTATTLDLVTNRTIPTDIADLLQRHHGILTSANMTAAGLDPSRLRRLAATGLLLRPTRGAYVDPNVYDDADSWAQHLVEARAVARATPFVHLTGWSAIAHFSLPTLGPAPAKPDLIDPRGSRGRNATARRADRRRVLVPPRHQLVARDGVRLVTPAFAVADLARKDAVRAALVAADAAAHRRHGVVADVQGQFDLNDAVAAMARWAGRARAAFVAAEADDRAESALESLGRFAFLVAGLPRSVSNASVRMSDGTWYRLDHLWPHHGVVAEGDGALKYDVLEKASQRMTHERERDWALRRHDDLDILHYTWELAFHRPGELSGRIEERLRANPIRPDPVRWWIRSPDGTYVQATAADQPSPWPRPVVLPAAWDRRLP